MGISAAQAAPPPTFDAQRAAMGGTVATQPEAAILALLQAGLAEGKATPAIAEAQTWLRQNVPEDPMLLYHAGRTAELSGDWEGAAALYQQYLSKADLASPTADEAVYAVYTLLLERLKDTAGTYSFSRTEGDRLLVCPRARQFDEWFLEQAVHQHRQDVLAVARRLRACIEAGLPNDLLLARYDNYFRWLLERVGGSTGFCRETQVTQETLDACKGLASVMTFGEELKLLLDWDVSVKFYVQQRLADEDVPPPIAEATVLLAKYPHHAIRVQLGWAGGTKDNHSNHVGDTTKYWSPELEAKMAPVVQAAAKLSPSDRAQLLASWQPEGYWREWNRVKLREVKVVSDYLKANPELTQTSKTVSPLTKDWKHYTPEEAAALAPQIAQNRHPYVSLVRAIAAGGEERDFDKVMAAFRGPERWRLSANDMRSWMTDQLWHYCNRPGGSQKRDREIAESKELAKQMDAKLVGADAPENQRIAQFRKLWNDYRSPQPEIPGVAGSLKTVLQFTPEAIPELLGDPSLEAQNLARSAIEKGMTGPDPMWKELGGWARVSASTYNPVMMGLVRHHRGLARMKQEYPQLCKPHPLEEELRAHIADGLKQNRLIPWQLITWINMQWPEDNAEQVKLMQAMFKSPGWRTMPFEIQFAAREWFGKDAMTPAQAAWVDAAAPALVCKDLLTLPKEADVETTAAALSRTLERIRKAPVRMAIQGIDQLAAVSEEVFADPDVMPLILDVTDGLRYVDTREDQPFGDRLYAYVSKRQEPLLVHRTAACLWQYGASGSRGKMYEPMKRLSVLLTDSHPASAHALARVGIASLSAARNIYGYDPRRRVPEMKALAGKIAMKLGLITIPVPRNHPAYPVYKSQAEWLTANEDSAWTMLDEAWDQLLPIHRELAVDYLMWALQRTIYSRDDARQEQLVKALLEWAGEAGTPWGKAQRVDLEIAYGDIALQLGQLENAHKIFVRTQQNPVYADMIERHNATLRRVKVERIAKRFDDALRTLGELDMERIPELWGASRYARAEVYYAMEEYDDAADDIAAILGREPGHAEAKIMQGKVQLKRQKLMEASELDVGSKGAQETMTPGEKLKVTLVDPTLAVSGAGTEIEVVVWATSGDRERLFLRQFGDQKTKFRGEVDTALGKPAPDDRVLQVIGDDEIYYGYSKRFREKMNNMDEKRGGPITVRSDAILMASARKLLSEAEQRLADMEAKMAEIARGQEVSQAAAAAAQAQAAREAAGKTHTREEREAAETAEQAKLAKSLLEARVKPGKAINVRVIDPDRSRTAEIDEVAVSIESSSGDSIGRVVLRETDTHSGWFEGSVPTAGAQAMAFARNTEPGRNPNMVISPTPGYPAWRPVAVQGTTPEFKIDLNDNVALGELTITAKEPGAKLHTFLLQTGMNAREMTTIAVFPKDQLTLAKPWHPSVTIMNDTDHHHVRDDRSVYDLREIEQHLDRGWTTQRYAAGVAENVVGPSAAMGKEIPGKVNWRRQDHYHNAHVVYRFRGYFHEPVEVTRRFRVELGKFQVPENTHPSVAHPPQFLLAVDGRPITDKEKPGRLEGEALLRPGVHRFEIWATGWDCTIGFGRSVKLLANVDDPEKLNDCPDSFFDPATFPHGVLPHRNARATAAANDDGTAFKVAFAPDSHARLLNLVLIGQEGPVPALNTIALTDVDGERVLPVAEDYATLNKNDTLEILTGDKVAVRYVDDRFVDKAKQKHERFLNVAFSDAGLGFVHFERRLNRSHELEDYYEGLLRFQHGKPLYLKLFDPDMDMTDESDTVEVVLESKAGAQKTFEVKETGPSTAIFRLMVVPVPGPPANDTQFQVAAGGTITAVYRDEENVKPGVPTDRLAPVQHAQYSLLKLRTSHATVTPIDYEALAPEERPGKRALNIGFATLEARHAARRQAEAEAGEGLLAAQRTEGTRGGGGGLIKPRWQITNAWADSANPPDDGIAAVHGQRLHFEIEAPHLALRAASHVEVYVQTDAGRDQGDLLGGSLDGDAAGSRFDTSLPGTMKLTARLLGAHGGYDRLRHPPQIPIYVGGDVARSDGGHWSTTSSEIFGCSVPLIAGFLPAEGVLSDEEIQRRRERKEPVERTNGLVVRPGERIHIGVPYTHQTGVEQWLTASAKVITHAALDVMSEDLRDSKAAAYVGETLHLRVVDLGADVSDQSDTISVLMQAKSGAKHKVELLEVDTHSGVFQARVELSYLQGAPAADQPSYDVKRNGFPVVYDDTLGVRYTDVNGVKTEPQLITIRKGADGDIRPFSKKYDDPSIAMRTQFALAEAYLEMAKRHRLLGETGRAEDEYARAKDMLQKAMEMFRDPATRAHAEYLLGNLTQEEADTTDDPALKEDRYRAALSRYMRVTGSYADTIHASKAQFQIATVYERMNEPEIAAQEYVKLAYKYPDSEFLALAMARLGTHFQRKAAAYEKKATELLAQPDDKDARFEGQAMERMYVAEYVKSAEVFGRLQERFPDHRLAGKGGLRAGQAYMRARDNRSALAAFRRVFEHEAYDGPDIRAQAMYWAGKCYENLREDMAAYSIYKRLTYDFPESKWASYARSQLSQDRLLSLEEDLETKRLEEGR